MPGKVVAVAGLAGVVWSAFRAVAEYRDRPDPYDLNRLWDAPPAEPETPDRDAEKDALVLCHRCGASMPAHVGVCLECGNRLGY